MGAPSSVSGGGSGIGDDIHAAAAFVECNFAIDEGEQSPIAAGADVLTSDEFGAALADENATGGDQLAEKPVNSEAFADAVTSVADAALTFFMCHNLSC